MNLEVQMLSDIKISLPLDIYAVLKLLYHTITTFKSFKGLQYYFFVVAVPIYIPTDSVHGFFFIHILTNTYL